MQSNKNDSKVILTPSGAGIAAICFFLPWMKISCMGETKYVSGADIGGILWAVFIAALLIIMAVMFYKNKNEIHKAKAVVSISSLAALLIIFFKFGHFFILGEETALGRIKPKDVGMTIHIGSIGTVIGFILSLIGIYQMSGPQIEMEYGEPAEESVTAVTPPGSLEELANRMQNINRK